MTTARELITDALNDVGVLDAIETMSAEQAQHGLRTLNRIVDSWNAKRLMVYAVRDVVASWAGASASVGTGLTVDVAHPLRLEQGCYYVKSGNSYPLPVWTRENYNAVILKATAGDYPQGIFYDRQVPGTVYVWPVPSVSTEYHLQVLQRLSAFADLDTDYSFPDGYVDAFFQALRVRLPAGYNLAVDPDARDQERKAVAAIRKNNTQVPQLNSFKGLGRLNILTNQWQ